MFDIGMAEMAVVGVVALIIVGPKDLPMMFRKVGQFVGKARGMAREFQRAMDQAADESGIGDVSKTIKQATSMKNLGLDDATKSFQEFQTGSGKPKTPKKIDSAALHADRVKTAEDANKAAENSPVGKGNTEQTKAPKKAKAATKSPVKKAAARKATAKKPAARKPAAEKPTAKKPAAKTAAKKPAAKKSPAKRPAAKKPAAGKSAKSPKAEA